MRMDSEYVCWKLAVESGTGSLCLPNAPSVVRLMNFNNALDLYCKGLNLFRNKGEMKTQTESSSIISEPAKVYWPR